MRKPTHEVFVQVANQRTRMQVHELLSQNFIHSTHIVGVCPVRIVHGRKCNPMLLTFERSQHHMGGVYTVHEVRREGCCIFAFVYWLVVKIVGH